MTLRSALLALAALAAVAAVPIAAVSAPSGPSTAQGVYSEAQAGEGAALYAGQCSMCHGQALEGTFENPALTGRFLRNWSHGPLSGLFEYVGSAMPQTAPGSLSPEDTARIIAFLLKANGMPAGRASLPADSKALKAIGIEPVKR